MATVTKKDLGFLPWFVCGLGALFYAYEYMLRVEPGIMTVQLSHFFEINNASLGNLSAIFYYIYTPMQLVAGILMDRYGPRRVLSFASLCCIGGSVLFALTPHLYVAQAGRLLIGFGAAFAFVGVLKLATIWLPNRYFAFFAGLATTLGMGGAIISNIALIHLVNIFGWRHAIYITAYIGLAITILMFLFIRDENPNDNPAEVHTENFKSVLTNMGRIIRCPQMWIIGLIGCILYLPDSAFAELWANPFLQTTFHLTNVESGIAVTAFFIGWSVGGPLGGWISDIMYNRRFPIMLNATISGVLLLLLLFLPRLSFYDICGLMAAIGFFAAIQVVVFAIGKELFPKEAAGSAIAFTNMVVMLGGVVFQPLIGYFLDWFSHGVVHSRIDLVTPHQFRMALLILPISMFLTTFIAMFCLQEKRAPAKLELSQPNVS